MLIDMRDITNGTTYYPYVELEKQDLISQYVTKSSFSREEIKEGVYYVIGRTSALIRELGYPESATDVQVVIPEIKEYIFKTSLEEINPEFFPAISHNRRRYKELKGFLNKDTSLVVKAMDDNYSTKIAPERIPAYMDIMAEITPEIIDCCFEKLSIDIKQFIKNQQKEEAKKQRRQQQGGVKFAYDAQLAYVAGSDEEDPSKTVSNAGTIPTKQTDGDRRNWKDTVRQKRKEDKENAEPDSLLRAGKDI